ncbi:MAG: hypothetical protein AB7O86_05730 [Porticoccaceae bacterium]
MKTVRELIEQLQELERVDPTILDWRVEVAGRKDFIVIRTCDLKNAPMVAVG